MSADSNDSAPTGTPSTSPACELDQAFDQHRQRLSRMVKVRMDQRLRRRIDASDVIQEAYLEALERFDDFQAEQKMPLFLWLRFLVGQRLITLHRRHLGTKMRNPAMEISLHRKAMPEASSVALAEFFVADQTSPSEAVAKVERTARIQMALSEMEDIDREALTLRHFEHLSRRETAEVLGIEESAAGKRYLRALKRLKQALVSEPDSESELDV